MHVHLKFDDILKRKHRAAAERLARTPATTTDSLHQWMLARQYKIGRTAVGNWLRRQRAGVADPVFALCADLLKNASRIDAKMIRSARQNLRMP
jgi:hypothetical protein